MLAKQIIIDALIREPQTARGISQATGIKFSTVQGVIWRLCELGAVYSDSVAEDEFRRGPKRKLYKPTEVAS